MSEQSQVLIVEDDQDIRELMVEILESEGYSTMAAACGREGLQKLTDSVKKPDLILLDLRLPGLDGFQFREAQLQNPSIADIPVVLISADTGLEEKNNRIGASGVLKKPVELDALVEMVKQQLLH